MINVQVSTLVRTWLIDIDGTILVHNGHRAGGDTLLPGTLDFWRAIPPADTIVLMSARTKEERPMTLSFIDSQGLRYDHAIFGLPKGERILINDAKPGGLKTAVAIVLARDTGLGGLFIEVDPTL